MIVIDASVWISLLFANDVNHPSSIRLTSLMDHRRIGAGVPAHFLAEIAGVMFRQRTGSALIQAAINEIRFGPLFSLYPITVELGENAGIIAGSVGIRGADAIYVALATLLEVPLVTWDFEQRDRGSKFCRTLTPLQALHAL